MWPTPIYPALFDALVEAGERHGIGVFGAYAMNSMRLEKGYRAWGADLTTERSPHEAGLGYLVKTAGRELAGGDAWSMVLLEIGGAGADPFHGHAVKQDGVVIGIVTSGGFGHRTGKTLALAYLRTALDDGPVHVEILGHDRPATVLDKPPYDPTNARLKG